MEPLAAARLRPRGLRLHDLHRQQRAARRARRQGRRGQRPGGRGRALGQPQLRGPHPSPGAGELPRLAAAGGGLRARGTGGHRPDDASRSAADRDGAAGVPGGHLAVAARRSGRRSASAVTPELFRPRTPASSRATSGGARCRCPTGDRYAWDPASSYIALPPFFEGLTAEPAPITDIVGRAGAGGAGRLGDHRPHLAGRIHPRLEPGRAVAAGARRGAAASSTATAPAAAITR